MSDYPSTSTSRSPDFWEEHYQTGTTRWDLGEPAPPFVSLLQSAEAPPIGRMAVLGSGRGHDALWFARQGFEVVGFDFAPSAISQSTALAQAQGISAQFLQRDIFELTPEFADQFDYVLEHTCFCAIPLKQRPAYVRLVRDLLHPQGELIALFWLHDRPNGPPYGGSVDEIYERFASNFDILSLKKVTDSVANRKNEEYLGRLRVKKS